MKNNLEDAIDDLRKHIPNTPEANGCLITLIKASASFGAQTAKEEIETEIQNLKAIIGLQESVLQAWKSL